MKVGYSLIVDDLNIHKLATEILFEQGKDDTLAPASNFIFINGVAGAGKTSTVQQGLFYMCGETGRVTIVTASAPNAIQSENLGKALTLNTGKEITTIDKRGLLKKFFREDILAKLAESTKDPEIKGSLIQTTKLSDGNYTYEITPAKDWIRPDLDTKTIPNLIFIDEVTHFNKAELQMLQFIG